jgi:recombination protein RecA
MTERYNRLAKAITQRTPKASVQLTTPGIVHWNSTGSPMLDLYLRGGQEPGGYPGGKFVEFHGPESSGKTGLALAAIAECQTVGGMGIFLGAEGLDEGYARNVHNVAIDDPERWMYVEPYSLEAACATLEAVVVEFFEAPHPTVVVVDSLSALGAADYSIDKHQLKDAIPGAAEAKLMHRFFRRGILYYLAGSPITIILIRHSTESPRPYEGVKTTHGKAPDYHTWVRLRFKRKALKESETGPTLGYWITVTCTKNKLGPDHWAHSMPQYWDGFDRGMEVLGYLLNQKVAVKDTKGYVTITEAPDLGKRYPGQWRKAYREDENIAKELDSIARKTFQGK